MRILLRKLHTNLGHFCRNTKRAWLPDTNFKFWDITLRLLTPRNDDGPCLIGRPAPLSWRARIGIDSLRVGQPLCAPTTLWQPVL
eukprot:6201504-Pleurochrysis_carterae.AAC.1